VAAARQAKVPRFVHIGTEAILLHDRFPVHMADESVPAPLPPFHAPYTRSKILAERAVLVRACNTSSHFERTARSPLQDLVRSCCQTVLCRTPMTQTMASRPSLCGHALFGALVTP
jgi:hypothetical protein